MLSLAVLSVSILVASTLWLSIDYVTSPLRKVPGPFLASFTNLYRFIVVLRGSADKKHRELHDRHGKYVRLGPNCVSISDSKMIDVVYDGRGGWPKSKFYAVADFVRGSEVICTGFSTRNEQDHLSITRPIADLYTTTAVIAYEARLNEAIGTLIDTIKQYAGTNRVCPLDHAIHVFATNAMTLMTFSKTFVSKESGQNNASLVRTSYRATKYLAVVGQMPFLDKWLAKNPVYPLGPPSTSTLAQFAAEKLMERRREGSKEEPTTRGHQPVDFLDHFAKKSDDVGVKVQWMMRNVAAGSDSTAISIISVIYHLCQSSKALNDLSEELEKGGVFGKIQEGEQVEYSRLHDVSQFPYLDAVIRESWRIHPPVALGMERVVKGGGFRDGDVFLPEGTIVSINPAVIHHDRDLFGPDADEFRPGRWSQQTGEDEETYGNRLKLWDRAMLTFGRGKRKCPGKHLADMEIRKCIVTLVALFDFTLEKVPSKHAYWFHYLKNMYVKVALKHNAVQRSVS
ncbi:Cytochrome P450-like protein 21 [Elsinoe fawcettii]|nr:Cytochrome P450-like protein 21 [Elsinoe fawcettii]